MDNVASDLSRDVSATILHLRRPRAECDPQRRASGSTQCLSNGKYCGRDPSGKIGDGVEGKDVVMENLRQMCIWKVLNDNVRRGSKRTELMKWWCYANDFSDQCFDFGGEK